MDQRIFFSKLYRARSRQNEIYKHDEKKERKKERIKAQKGAGISPFYYEQNPWLF